MKKNHPTFNSARITIDQLTEEEISIIILETAKSLNYSITEMKTHVNCALNRIKKKEEICLFYNPQYAIKYHYHPY